jgi:ligand-binding sensor domain-containing protein/signal transduction histidine kinase/DNA-binding response OmpR family regulator
VWATVFAVKGQSPPLKFKHLSFKEGLAQSPISSIVKDSKGFIWLGNWKGLTRYDGYTFRTFNHQPNNAKSISNNRVNAIVEDKHGKLWIGTSNGLNAYDPSTEIFKRIDIRNVKGGRNYISSIKIDSYGKIWTSTFAGVKLVDTTKVLLRAMPSLQDNSINSLATAVTFTLFEDRDRIMWVGSKNGVKRFDPKTQKLVPLPSGITNHAEFMSAKIIVIRQDKLGNMWFGSEASGLYCYNPTTNVVRSFNHLEGNSNSLLSNWVRDIFVYDAENIWVGTRNGLSVYNTVTNKFTNYAHHSLDPDGLNDSTIWSFMLDEAGGIWIGTFAGGLNVYYPQNGNFVNIGEGAGQRIGLSHPMVNAIAQDKDESLWIGTYGGGINHFNLKTKAYTFHPIRNDQKQTRNGVKSLALDPSGNLWVGTLDGLCLFNKTTKEIKFFNFSVSQGKFSENLINAIVPDAGLVWVGTNGGGLRCLKPDGSYLTFTHNAKDKNSISDNFVTALLSDSQHNLWIGTQNGLNYYDAKKNKFIRYGKNASPYSLNNNSIITLLKDSKDRLWIGTEGGGLSYYDVIENKFYALNASAQLTDEVIHSILEDDNGLIWLSTDNGLYKLRFKNFNLPFTAANIAITNYNANDGLSSNQFLTNSSIKLKDGGLMFGGINGLTYFYPQQLLKNTLKPKVVFTDFLIRNKDVVIGAAGSPLEKSITFAKRIQLHYDEGYITIKFAALNFVNSEKNQYAYKMDGVNGDDWHYSGTQREANYTNLEPGHYTFKVMAANNDGVWNNDPISIQIVVLPPWWQTWWAYTIYAVLVYGVARTIYSFLRNRAKLKRELYLEHVAHERQEELHQMKIDFFTNISHEIRTPLTLILGPLEKMLLSTGANAVFYKQLLQVQNNANRLLRLVTELMDFRKAESGYMKLSFSLCNIVHFTEEIYLSFQNLAEDKNINYRFKCDIAEINVYFDKDHLEKVLFNLLSNAFKFTPEGGKIEVVIVQNETSVLIRITDNGTGISPKNIEKLFQKFFQVYNADVANNGYGIGLALSKSIVELHKGTIEVASETTDPAQRSTSFTVTLPKGAAHLDPQLLMPEYMNSDNPVHYYLQSQANHIIAPEETIIATTKYTVLVIEDNMELRNFIKESFQEQYQILLAANGAAGLALTLEKLPDLIISDVMMPEMDGLELCRRLKGDERINHIPVILLTARAAYIHQINGLERGADAYITKPFSVQVLALNVKNILATKEAGRQKFIRELLLNPQPREETTPDEKFLNKLMALIEKNIDNSEFDVSAIVEELGMSKTVLYKKVQALTNLSVADLIKSIRLKRAAVLLTQNQLGIAEIAFSVGFTDRKYFSKEFRKLYGVSPSNYISIDTSPKE